jgi:hypothetical protein
MSNYRKKKWIQKHVIDQDPLDPELQRCKHNRKNKYKEERLVVDDINVVS